MCGICGMRLSEAKVEVRDLAAMTARLRHRGPDDEGYFLDREFGAGHTRLSIIDLSRSGAQPMVDPSGRYCMVFNGEIYNAPALRARLETEGERFRGHSDTEVLLRLFARDGAACLAQLNGMFAFAVWDRRERSLFLARDPFGIKPLYVAETRHGVAFASEIKALLTFDGLEAALNPAGLADYLTFQYALGDKTLFQVVRKLLPGRWLKFGPDGMRQEGRFWCIRFDRRDMAPEAAVTELHALLDDSVRSQLRSDVPVGCHLSGGIDTGTITALARRHHPGRIEAFTARFAGGGQFDDSHFARISAAHIGCDLHEIVPDAEDFRREFDRLIWALDEPVAAPGSFAQYFVSKLAATRVKVVLGGQGADELAGGYARYLIFALDMALKADIHQKDQGLGLDLAAIRPGLPQLANYFPLMQQSFGRGLSERPAERFLSLIRRQDDTCDLLRPGLVDPRDTVAEYEALFDAPGPQVSLLDKVLHFETTQWLPALLQVEDRTSMAWSLESRVPFLDTRIAELLFSLPPATKLRDGRLKHLVRAAAADLLAPEIASRRDKVGFPVPVNQWLGGPLSGWLRERLLETPGGSFAGFFQRRQVETQVSAGSKFGREVWGLLCLESWSRQFLDQPAAGYGDSVDPARVVDVGGTVI